MVDYKKIENYSIYGIYVIILLFILHNINKLLLNLIPECTLFIVLELVIIIIQLDNFSLLYDYKEVKQYYEKIINDEYRINKLTTILNNLLQNIKNIENAYFKLLSNNDKNLKLLEIELSKYKSLYNIVENKITKIKNNSLNSKSFESIISDSSSLDLIEYKSNKL